MQPVSLAFFWHQHQPYYPDDVAGETLMPWVRLHGTKDYYGMAMHVKEVPEFRCTINLVPSLLVQLQAYTEPIVALITLPFAYVGEVAWNLAWLAYIPVTVLLKRRQRR